MELYGRRLSRRDIAARAGVLGQFAGVRLMELADGAERGVRMLEFRTGSGLRFTVMVDRGFDVAECEHAGRAIGWNSAAGFPHPGLHEYEGEGGLGFLRSFSGLLATCGLDHFGFMQSDSGAAYHYPPRATVDASLHGRAAFLPGRLLAYGEHWDGDECTLYAEGEVRQAAVFGENLALIRRIEARVGGNGFVIRDRVENRGFARTPHMLLYHVNVGHPVVDEGSRYLAPIRAAIWASHADRYQAQGVGYRTLPAPMWPFLEQVWQHDMVAGADGFVPVAVVNDRIGFGFVMRSRRAELPCHLQWQNFAAGGYCMGIEPGTNYAHGKSFARERGECAELEHGDSRSYETRYEVLDGAAAIAAAEAEIRAIGPQPDDAYPALSGVWPALPPIRP
jgi:hypothetical protein